MANTRPRLVIKLGEILSLQRAFETTYEIDSQALTIPAIFAFPCSALQELKNSPFCISKVYLLWFYVLSHFKVKMGGSCLKLSRNWWLRFHSSNWQGTVTP